MKRTIRLSSDYRLNAGVVEGLFSVPTGHQFDYSNPNFSEEYEKSERWEWHPTRYEIGAQAVLVSHTDVSPNALRAGTRAKYSLSFDLAGVPGNMNRNIKSTTGWRGTTDDVSVDAHGIVTVRAIRTLKNGDVAVTVS